MQVYSLEQGEAGVPPGDGWLSEAERSVLARLRVPKRRADWRLGRWTAKRVVAAWLGQPDWNEALAAIEVLSAKSGAPELFINGRPMELTLSLSHSGGAGFCTLAAGHVLLGCDVEIVAPRGALFVEDYFTREERDFIAGTPAARQDLAVTAIWSAKESVLKAMRCGLRVDTRSISVALADFRLGRDDRWQVVWAANAAGQSFQGWWRTLGAFVWTVVGIPAPACPIRLHVWRAGPISLVEDDAYEPCAMA